MSLMEDTEAWIYLMSLMNDSEAPMLLIDDTEFQIVRHFKGQLYGEEPEFEVVSGCTER
jgi:hypothetical protein